MIINAILFTFSADDADRAADLLRELRGFAHTEAGCIRYDAARSIKEPNVFAMFEEWTDEAALDAHYASGLYGKVGTNGIRKLAKERIRHLCLPLD